MGTKIKEIEVTLIKSHQEIKANCSECRGTGRRIKDGLACINCMVFEKPKKKMMKIEAGSLGFKI